MKLPDTESTKSILFVFMLYFIIFLLVYGFFSIRWRSEGCPETVLNQTTSPNGAWVASITQSRCGNDIWPTILGEVDLVRSDGSGERTTILGVDTGGNASEYPRATWSGSASLKIIV